LGRWYPSAAEHRRLVPRLLRGDSRVNRQALAACIGGSDAACLQLLSTVPASAFPKPLGYNARATLVDLALRLGGRGAYHVLATSEDMPIGDRLAAAAGVPIDSLISRWRAEIIASRPEPVALPPWGLWIAVGWVVAFAGCGLRSSRWRVS
jgi:hypothetical protein